MKSRSGSLNAFSFVNANMSVPSSCPLLIKGRTAQAPESGAEKSDGWTLPWALAAGVRFRDAIRLVRSFRQQRKKATDHREELVHPVGLPTALPSGADGGATVYVAAAEDECFSDRFRRWSISELRRLDLD